MALSILYNVQPVRLFEADGDFAAGAKAYFYLARTTTPLTVYTDAPMTAAHTWPVVADAYGLLPPIYIAKGTEYKVRIEDALGSILYAADGISNPEDVIVEGGGGGGGVVVAADEIFQTGDVMWNPASGARAGWVRCNGRTISKASGAGTESNNDDCHDLFVFLWNNFNDSICPVTPGGRGGSAQADWDLAKAIATLDMRGRSAVGLDDMGNTAANLIQVATTINTTNASAAATVASSDGLASGMFVLAAGVTAGTKIARVDTATTITLSANATATATGVAARFSAFSDAQTPGAAGGENTHTLLVSEGGLKEQYFDMAGKTEQVVLVPTWAKMVEFQGSCFLPTGTGATVQISGDGTTFVSSAVYSVAGPYHDVGGSTHYGTQAVTTANALVMTLAVVSSTQPIPHVFAGHMSLTGPAATFIILKSQASNFDDTLSYRSYALSSAVNLSEISGTEIRALRFGGGLFGAGSRVSVRWFGDDATVPAVLEALTAPEDLEPPEAPEGALTVPSGRDVTAGTTSASVGYPMNLHTPARVGTVYAKK
jgi:hypothetical protein